MLTLFPTTPQLRTDYQQLDDSPMNTIQAINLLGELTYGEIREQLDLAGIESISELDDQQVYALAIECLTDY